MDPDQDPVGAIGSTCTGRPSRLTAAMDPDQDPVGAITDPSSDPEYTVFDDSSCSEPLDATSLAHLSALKNTSLKNPLDGHSSGQADIKYMLQSSTPPHVPPSTVRSLGSIRPLETATPHGAVRPLGFITFVPPPAPSNSDKTSSDVSDDDANNFDGPRVTFLPEAGDKAGGYPYPSLTAMVGQIEDQGESCPPIIEDWARPAYSPPPHV
eukprot:gene21358-28296_t